MNELQTITVPKELTDVDKAIYLVRLSDKASGASRELLYKVFTEKTWQDRFSSWGDFVESKDGLSKSQGWASKQLKVHTVFCIEGGKSPKEIEGIDNEVLYLSTNLQGTVDEKLVRAETWSRADMKKEIASKDGVDCTHPEDKRITICSCCNARV